MKIAEILVECGYAKSLAEDSEGVINGWVTICDSGYGIHEKVDPFADTLEGRRQLDALEDWLKFNQYNLWNFSEEDISQMNKSDSTQMSSHQWRLDRIKWCIEQLEEK